MRVSRRHRGRERSPPTCSGIRACAPSADVLHCPTFRGPFRAAQPLVVTVHDLAVLRHPEWFNRWTRTYSRVAVPRVVAAAHRVIAVSEFTKRELGSLLGTDAAKIRVVPNAVEDVFSPEGPRAEGDYVLAVGTLEPRKNLARIAQAVDGELRVVGARGWGGVEPPRDVTWLGDISDEDLAAPLPRCAVPRLRLALRGLRDSRGGGARLRLPGGDESRFGDGRVRRKRRDLCRPARTSRRFGRASSRPAGPSRAAGRRGPTSQPRTRAVYAGASRDRSRRGRARPQPNR